jgi:hypothetical protein
MACARLTRRSAAAAEDMTRISKIAANDASLSMHST